MNDRELFHTVMGMIRGDKYETANEMVHAIIQTVWQAARQAPASGEVEPVAHVFPDDLKRLQHTECAVEAYSVEMGHPERGETVPLFLHHPPAKVPEGQVMVPREFLAEYYDLVTDSDFTALHKLVRKNAISALLTTPTPAATAEMEWVKCSERLPTEADEDCRGDVWSGYADPITKRVGEVHLTRASVVSIFAKKNQEACYWRPTGLTRPAPPQEQ